MSTASRTANDSTCLVGVDFDLVGRLDVLRHVVLNLLHLLLGQQRVLVSHSNVDGLLDALKVTRDGDERGVEGRRGIDIAVRRQNRVATAPAEADGADPGTLY